ncbi:MAG: DUF6286 domain-containing protein [Pseudonocardia sp.]
MNRRPRRSIPAALVATALLALAVVTAVTCVQMLLGQAPLVDAAALLAAGGSLAWSQPPVLAAAGVVAALGLVLVLVAVTPGTPTVLALETRDGVPDAGATRRSLGRALALAASDVDGVSAASVRVRARTVTATVRTPLYDAADLPDQVRDALATRLADIAPARPPRVRVRARTEKGAS